MSKDKKKKSLFTLDGKKILIKNVQACIKDDKARIII